MLNPQARLQAAQWEKNNTVQIVTFISHKHTCKLGATGCTSPQKSQSEHDLKSIYVTQTGRRAAFRLKFLSFLYVCVLLKEACWYHWSESMNHWIPLPGAVNLWRLPLLFSLFFSPLLSNITPLSVLPLLVSPPPSLTLLIYRFTSPCILPFCPPLVSKHDCWGFKVWNLAHPSVLSITYRIHLWQKQNDCCKQY